MNPLQDHALATARHAERYPTAGRAGVVPAARRAGGRAGVISPARERVGLLLVEAGLQLLVRGGRPATGDGRELGRLTW